MVFQTEEEKKEYVEQLTFYRNTIIKHNKSITEEEATLLARQTISNLNISFVLADVCNSFLSDTESNLKRMGMALSGEDKHRFLLMQKSIKQARIMASAFARPLYHIKDATDACSCSDWYYHFLQLVETKITDDRKTRLILEFLLTMPDENGVYKVKMDDFID